MSNVGRPKNSKYKIEDYIGQTINRWTIIGFSHLNNKGEQYWDVKCSCGNTAKTRVYPLVKGKSCGCKSCRPQSTIMVLEGWNPSMVFSSQYYYSIMSGASIRNLEFLVSPTYINELFIKQKGKCALSDIDLTFSKRFKNHDGNASLDRIDSKLGYIEGNIQWVHKTINSMKLNLDENVFLDFCRKITIKNFNLL